MRPPPLVSDPVFNPANAVQYRRGTFAALNIQGTGPSTTLGLVRPSMVLRLDKSG
jgi:hypothetical protein